MELTQEEIQFIEYWAKNRQKNKRFIRKILWGLPVGITFSSLILINWLSGWDKHVYKVSVSLFITVVVGLIGVSIFIAYIKMQIDWGRKEQYFNFLQTKKNNSSSL